MTMPSSFATRIGTLVARERRTRNAGGAFAFIWAYANPLFWIAFVVLAFRLLGRSPSIFVPAEAFIATGVLPYIIFRQTITSLSRTVIANRYLQYITPVSPNELLIASAISELINSLSMALIVFTFLIAAFSISPPFEPGGVAASLMIMWFLGAGIGRFFAVIGMASDSFARLVPIILRPAFWVSGIFYTAIELPSSVQSILWYSPTLHVTELVRESYFIGYSSPISTAIYPLCFGGLFLLASFPLELAIIRDRLSRVRL